MPEWLGKTIGNVRIEKLLARGGMAEVYLGSHLNLERPVAVKLLHSYIEEEPILLERFHREARVVAGLRHPNIVQIFDFDTIDGHPYIVMEYLRGPTLAAYLRYLHQRKKRIPPDQVARLLKTLTAALDYAHGQGVIHRDIKPSNILLHNKADDTPLEKTLTNDVEAIVTDFGLVRVVDAASQTSSGTISGTPAYMSPEQARGDLVDHRTDIYSLGIVLYEMLAGRVPFEADSTMTILHMQIHTLPPSIPGIPAKVQAVMDRALQKNPNDRYQTSQEMAIDFYLAIGMAAQAEAIRDPYRVSTAPMETAIEAPVSLPPKPAPPAEPPPMPAPSPRPESPPTSAPTQLEPLPMPSPTKPELPPKPTSTEPAPSSKPTSTEPVPSSKPARSWVWIAVGLLSFICLAVLGVGALRFFSNKPNFPKPTQVGIPPVIPNTGTSPLPSEPPGLPPSDGMVQVPAGTYEVGTTLYTDDYHIAPQKISLDSFWIDQYQTTNSDYREYLKQTGAQESQNLTGEDKLPVMGVTWDQAVAYCSWKNKRLPDEAEWEAAGRGGGPAPQLFPWGTDPTAGGDVLKLPNHTYEVGSQPFNVSPLKVYDMVGNVWEWVGEPYASTQNGYKILRGGRFGNPQDLAYRVAVAPDDPRYIQYAGFRCAADQVR